MQPNERIPPLVLALFASGLSLALLYVAFRFIDVPSDTLRVWTNLDNEKSIATWFSTVQLLVPSILLAPLIVSAFARRQGHPWALLLLALLFVGLSADESIEAHEYLGNLSDKMLPNDDRGATFFSATGIWMFVLGVPFVIVLGLLIRTLRGEFARVPGVTTKLIVGGAIWLGGALGIELLRNVVDHDSALGIAQVFFEETAEMMGVTVMVWGFYQLLIGCGFRWELADI